MMNPMSPGAERLGRSSAGFAVAAAVTLLFSTALAWVKDAYRPLLLFMNQLAWHNWITQGLADVILFVVLGLVLSRANIAERIAPHRLISFLAAAAVLAGAGLFLWYAFY
jgi:uncharacterized membrane protein SirB2